jgi:hypothetical protein
MMTDLDHQCHAILSSAISAEHGIRLSTNDPTRARQQLYRYRKAIGDTSFDEVHIRTSPDDAEHELWLIHRPKITLTFTADDLDALT